MTKRGFFIINGVPRVVLNQIIRSPGIYYQQQIETIVKNGKVKMSRVLYADLISKRGTWLRLEMDKSKEIWVCMKKTSRIPISLFLLTLGFNKKSVFLVDFNLPSIHKFSKPINREVETSNELEKSFLFKKFLNPKSYNLGKLGRLQLNQKLGLSIPLNQLTLTPQDLFSCIEGLIAVSYNKKNLDDIDHLKNRRVRGSGEFIANQLNQGLINLEKSIIEKINKSKKNRKLKLKNLINSQTIQTINECLNTFFASNPLSQYLDQTNPLAELTHKRRVSSLGPEGVNRETAGMPIRGIHPTYYGRICSIETPEGHNAGLVNSITILGRPNLNGFLESPYYLVYKGQVQKKLGCYFLLAKIENQFNILLNKIKTSSLNFLPKIPLTIRSEKIFNVLYRKNINFTIVSCFQLISMATSLIPFMEHNDANRALMGSNMQRQAVSLVKSQRPLIGTGFENIVIYDSNYNLYSKKTSFLFYKTQKVLTTYVFFPYFPIQKFYFSKFNLDVQIKSFLFPKTTLLSLCFLNNQEVGFNNFTTIKRINNNIKTKWIKVVYSKKIFNHISLFRIKAQLFKSVKVSNSSIKLLNLLKLIFYIRYPVLENFKFLLQLKLMFRKKFKNYNFYFYILNSNKSNFVIYLNYLFTPIKLKKFLIVFKTQYLKVERFHSFSSFINLKNQKLSKNCFFQITINYFLKTYNRTNQGTCLIQTPFSQRQNWIEKGELLTNNSFNAHGELALGQNLLVGYLPWEGYNFEDAVLINEKLVYEDIFTSLHIEKYETETHETPFGIEKITRQIPEMEQNKLKNLNKKGIIQVGSRVCEGDILVGKVTPIEQRKLLPHEKLVYDIIGKKNSFLFEDDSSLRVPKGVEGEVIQVQISELNPIVTKIEKFQALKITVSILERRRIKVGDKISGRHGNKGVISKILSRQSMPYLLNGDMLDMILNPLGVPSRMNVGQIFETLLGFSGRNLKKAFKVLPFDEFCGYEFSRTIVYLNLYQTRQALKQKWLFSPKNAGKIRVFDGRTGQCLAFPVMVGQSYMLKLIHMVDEKIHARATGPYSLITQQPLRGRAKHGGQRFGEMEVWALEGFGAAFTLQELLTAKSDDLKSRNQIIDAILHKSNLDLGDPESYNVLIRELKSLCLDICIVEEEIYI